MREENENKHEGNGQKIQNLNDFERAFLGGMPGLKAEQKELLKMFNNIEDGKIGLDLTGI